MTTKELRIYDVPGMPTPGPTFLETATNECSDPNDEKILKAKVEELYGRALYSPDNDKKRGIFQLRITFKKTETKDVVFLTGHPWRPDLPDNEIKFGPVQSDVMIIGKIPGYEEGKRWRNLVGASGQCLWNALEELANLDPDYLIDPTDWYVTNVIKFTHPDSKGSGAIPIKWFKDCAPLLQEELRIVRPKFILCLGGEATQALLGKKATLTSTAGQAIDLTYPVHGSKDDPEELHTAKVICCVHPAAVVRTADMYPQMIEQLKLFRKLLKGESVSRVETDLDHRIVTNHEDLKEIVDQIIAESDGNDVIAVDAEWHGNQPNEEGAYLRTIQFSHKAKFGCCVVLRSEGGKERFCSRVEETIKGLDAPEIMADLDLARKELARLFTKTEKRNVRVVGHFFRADLPWLINFGLDLRPQHYAPANDDSNPEPLGFIRSAKEGGMDTGSAAHAHTEVGPFKLEILASQLLGTPRYDSVLHDWKLKYCLENKLKAEDLDGYGMIPGEILYPYAVYDADVTRRLFDVFNGTDTKTGLLDNDRFGNNCREAFWISQRAFPAFLEMEMHGILLDRERAEKLTQDYQEAQAKLLQELQEEIKWPTFNPGSDLHRREFLFGEDYNRIPDKDDPSKYVRKRPVDAVSLGLTPLTSTGKRKKAWSDLVARGEESDYRACCDKETLSILSAENPLVKKLKNIRVSGQVLQSVLRRPKVDKGTNVLVIDEDGNLVYEKGLIAAAGSDGRVRTHIFNTKETGRCSSARPNLQAISKSKEAEYAQILGSKYKHPLRSVLRASPGHVLIEADYSGAEVLGMAILSGDANLIDHAVRSTLPKSDPRFYDIHSAVAVQTFRLGCAPTKKGLASLGMEHLRTAAKARFFGYAYGQGSEAAVRKAMEEVEGKADITIEHMEMLTDGLKTNYPKLAPYFAACRERVLDPGWICNSFGRYRRFRKTDDRQALGELQRQAMNFPKTDKLGN